MRIANQAPMGPSARSQPPQPVAPDRFPGYTRVLRGNQQLRPWRITPRGPTLPFPPESLLPIQRACLPCVQQNSCSRLHLLCQQIVEFSSAFRLKQDIYVVEECNEKLAKQKCCLHLCQSVVDSQAEQEWHDWVPLFAPLPRTKRILAKPPDACPTKSCGRRGRTRQSID